MNTNTHVFDSMVSLLGESLDNIMANQSNIQQQHGLTLTINNPIAELENDYAKIIWEKYFPGEYKVIYIGKAIFFPTTSNYITKYLTQLINDLNKERNTRGLEIIDFKDVGGWYYPREGFIGYQFRSKILQLFPHLEIVSYKEDLGIDPQ